MTHTQPWTHRYRPKSKEEIVGNSEAVGKLEKWIKSWEKKPPKKRAAFVYGPPGTGKTAAIQALAMEKGFDLLEINASDSRTKNRIEAVL